MLLFVLSGVGIHRSNFLKLGVKICTYNHHCSAPSSRALLVGLAPPTLLGLRSRHCHGINYTQNPLTGGSIAAHVSAKFKKQRAGSRNADNELQNPLQRRKMALAFFCVPKRSAISGDGLARRSSSPESIRFQI